MQSSIIKDIYARVDNTVCTVKKVKMRILYSQIISDWCRLISYLNRMKLYNINIWKCHSVLCI